MAEKSPEEIAEERIEEARRTGATGLSLTNLGLTAVPESIGQLEQLQVLHLWDNALTDLPESIGQLNHLQILNLSGNKLTALPESIGQMKFLQYLDLSGNDLMVLPEFIGQLNHLQQFQLYSNKLTALPESIGQLEQLQILNLGSNDLAVLPESIGQLKHLRKLELQKNKLTALPGSIGQLEQLQVLDLNNNKLTLLPESIGQLAQLQSLNLSPNRLTVLPESIGQLTQLESLGLDRNQLTALPESIKHLRELKTLNVMINRLTALPKSISELPRLEKLYLHGNIELGLPPEILGPDWWAVNRGQGQPANPSDILQYYFQTRREPKRRLGEAKILLVGQGGVGKTSLVKRLVDDEFDPEEEKTEGINISQWQVSAMKGEAGGEIRANVWDFGGQEMMHATHQFFLTKRSLYLLVLDARKGENESNIQYWLKVIQSYGGESPVLVVTNKIDAHHLELNENRLKKDYAPNVQGFFNVSCKTGTGIEELREIIEEKINALPHVYDEVPESYFNVKSDLEARAKSEDFIDIKDYRKLCRKHGLTKKQDQQILIRFLHDLGNVLNFDDPDNPYGLSDTNILNPEWVTGGVYKIINNIDLVRAQGVLKLSQLSTILDDHDRYPPERHPFIIGMMRKFELCFDFPDPSPPRLLIPELLQVNEPDLNWEDAASLNFQYHYNVLPGGIISRFIVRTHHNLTDKPTYWRSGVVLDIDGNRALVRGDTQAGKVFISVQGSGSGRRRALFVIRDAFKAIHATIPRIEAKEKVPLPDNPAVVVDYLHLRKLEELGTDTFLPEGADQVYRVLDLLEGVDDRRPFDVFLSHNSQDKPTVRRLGTALKKRGLKVWLDVWELQPGQPWQEGLEEAIETSKTAAVLVGKDGLGPWEIPEMRVCLNQFVTRRMPVIPVLLPGAAKEPKLPLFLQEFTWVDLRDGLKKAALNNLEWGITGKKPS